MQYKPYSMEMVTVGCWELVRCPKRLS